MRNQHFSLAKSNDNKEPDLKKSTINIIIIIFLKKIIKILS